MLCVPNCRHSNRSPQIPDVIAVYTGHTATTTMAMRRSTITTSIPAEGKYTTGLKILSVSIHRSVQADIHNRLKKRLIYKYIYTYINKHTYIYKYMYLLQYIYKHIHIFIYTYMYVCVYKYIQIYIHKYTYIYTVHAHKMQRTDVFWGKLRESVLRECVLVVRNCPHHSNRTTGQIQRRPNCVQLFTAQT